ncbi:hypothetical protein QLX08_009354 [Tetragonisca angustula]|uniref:Uncharacterized protein n=1 Tax=Tetragonisca angustula TaxID=166442 RepID=A0AAW0ZGQ7_9HYME
MVSHPSSTGQPGRGSRKACPSSYGHLQCRNAQAKAVPQERYLLVDPENRGYAIEVHEDAAPLPTGKKKKTPGPCDRRSHISRISGIRRQPTKSNQRGQSTGMGGAMPNTRARSMGTPI